MATLALVGCTQAPGPIKTTGAVEAVCAPGRNQQRAVIALDILVNSGSTPQRLVDIQLDQPQGVILVGAQLVPSSQNTVGTAPWEGQPNQIEQSRVDPDTTVDLKVAIQAISATQVGYARGAILTFAAPDGSTSKVHTCTRLAVSPGEVPCSNDALPDVSDYLRSVCS
jgi:hypothetical protein